MHSTIERTKKKRALSIFVPAQWATLIQSKYDLKHLHHQDFLNMKQLAADLGTRVRVCIQPRGIRG